MTIHYLQCFEQMSRWLSYDDTSGTYHELDQVPESVNLDREPGFYTLSAGEPAGVYPSAGGPVFFAGSERRRLVIDQYQATVGDDGDRWRFTLRSGALSISLLYTPPPYTGDLDEPDFFAWLTESLTRPQFYSFYRK